MQGKEGETDTDLLRVAEEARKGGGGDRMGGRESEGREGGRERDLCPDPLRFRLSAVSTVSTWERGKPSVCVRCVLGAVC